MIKNVGKYALLEYNENAIKVYKLFGAYGECTKNIKN